MIAGRPRLVIAHRGASGYLPEHTQEAKALAFGQGADFLEQDIVATRDDALLVVHDLHLDRVTDVVRRYPHRARADGRWYARDFTLAEIRELEVTERLEADGRNAVFPGRFPPRQGRFRLHTLADEITLLTGLNRATGRGVGLYVELKHPAWHRNEGIDLGAAVVACLAQAELSRQATPVWLQCFDPGELRALRTGRVEWPLVQLLAREPAGQGDWQGHDPLSDEGLAALARHVDAIGPWLGHVWRDGRDTGLTARAHAAGLAVHPWTLRADRLPDGEQDFMQLLRRLWQDVGVDALFTDFPDMAVAARDSVTTGGRGST